MKWNYNFLLEKGQGFLFQLLWSKSPSQDDTWNVWPPKWELVWWVIDDCIEDLDQSNCGIYKKKLFPDSHKLYAADTWGYHLLCWKTPANIRSPLPVLGQTYDGGFANPSTYVMKKKKSKFVHLLFTYLI